MQFPLRSHVWCKGLPARRICSYDLHKRGYDSLVHAQLAEAAQFASHCHQYCCQHDGNWVARASTVCRAHHKQMVDRYNPRHMWPTTHIKISHQHSRSSIKTASAAATAQRLKGQSSIILQASSAASSVSQAVHTTAVRHFCASHSSSSSTHHTTHRVRSHKSCAATAAVAPAAGASTAQSTTAAETAVADSIAQPAAEPHKLQPPNNNTNSSSKTQLGWQLSADLGRCSYRMIISYDGTAYSGWQLQSTAPTVQAHIERALSTVLREDRKTLCVGAAGRTDAGVHARGQVVQFYTNAATIDPERLPFKLNSLLPHDIRVLWMSQTAPDFIVTASAVRKIYHYYLDTGRCHDPLRHRYAHHCRKPLDLDAMRAGAALLIGTHDFTQFSNESKERLKRNPVKTLERLDVIQHCTDAVRLEVQGTGFLYKQVRHMTGALLALGEGRLGLEDITARLEVGNKQAPGAGGVWRGYNVAPAKGLQLFEVEYPAAVDDPSVLLFPDLPHDEYGRLIMRVPGASSVDEE